MIVFKNHNYQKPSELPINTETLEEILAALQDTHDEPVTEDAAFVETKIILEGMRMDMLEFYAKLE